MAIFKFFIVRLFSLSIPATFPTNSSQFLQYLFFIIPCNHFILFFILLFTFQCLSLPDCLWWINMALIILEVGAQFGNRHKDVELPEKVKSHFMLLTRQGSWVGKHFSLTYFNIFLNGDLQGWLFSVEVKCSSGIGKYHDHGTVLEIMGAVNLFFSRAQHSGKCGLIRSQHVLHRCTRTFTGSDFPHTEHKEADQTKQGARVINIKSPTLGFIPSTHWIIWLAVAKISVWGRQSHGIFQSKWLMFWHSYKQLKTVFYNDTYQTTWIIWSATRQNYN